MSTFTLRRTLPTGYDDAVARVRAALADQGFGIISEIDLAATLHAKLGVEVAPQVILGACRPQLAHEALQADPSIAAVLPCNVVVRGVDAGTSVVEAFDPHAMMALAGAEADDGAAGESPLARVAGDARTRLTAALDSLAPTA